LANLNHYLVNGNAGGNVDSNTFWQARAALRNVGNDQDIVYVVSRNTAEYCVRNLTPEFLLPTELLGTHWHDPFGQYGIVQSPRARGRIAFGEVIEWPHFPDGYLFAYDRSKARPLRIRNHHLAQNQGFQLTNDQEFHDVQRHPLANKYWRRLFGVGARNRTNGVAIQFTNAGSYTDPTL